MQEMKQILWYSRQRRLLKEVGDKIDAADKAAVEADMQGTERLSLRNVQMDEHHRCTGCRD